MRLIVDKKVYSDYCISNAIYWLCSKYTCKREQIGDFEEHIDITPKNSDLVISEDEVEEKFWSSMNDYKLREQVRKETKDIRTILYIKAFSDCDDISDEELREI